MPADRPLIFQTRRHFLKVVVFGGTAAGFACHERRAEAPLDANAVGANAVDAGGPAALAKQLAGETFDRCHAVRDGAVLPTAPVSATHDVVIIGGGPSGLAAAYRLRDRDVLLLEKEAILGGNCTFDQWEGIRMGTGGAFYTESEKVLVQLFDEIGAKGSKVVGTDALVINGEPVTDFFRDGATRLALPQKVKDDFRRSREDLLKVYKTKREKELDAIPFAKLLEPYAPEVRSFWDRFGRSNWGADAENTSGFIGAEAYTWAGGIDDPRWTFPGGLAGAAHRLGEVVTAALGDRAVTNASVVRVEREGKGTKESVVVRYFQGLEPKAVRARAAIIAVPKLFAKLIIPGLGDRQLTDMKANRYAPFPVFNVCLTSPGPEPAYDNWFLDTPFTDFVPADWIIYAGKGPPNRKTALTVYHPLRPEERAYLLIDDAVLAMADKVAEHVERHFPGTMAKIAEIHVYRRGHGMFFASPGRFAWVGRSAAAFGPIFFAHTDSAAFASFDGALEAADKAVKSVRAILKPKVKSATPVPPG